MINLESLAQVKAFARQDGALTALLWIASFAFTVTASGGSLGNLLLLSTPFFVAWRLVRFRNYALEGVISFRRGFAYCLYTFAYAALLFALAQYLYFRFLDHGAFANMFTGMINALAPIYEQNGMSASDIKDTVSLVATITPIQWAFLFMMQNLLICFIVSPPIALACMRRPNRRNHFNP